jgi:protein kinase C substrate 80K-H
MHTFQIVAYVLMACYSVLLSALALGRMTGATVQGTCLRVHPTAAAAAGTSACGNGLFFCRNKGYRARWLPSTFVDDGVCDCCDGTDEAQGCNNVCAVLGAEETRQLRHKLQQHEAGAAERNKLIKEGRKRRDDWAKSAKEAQATADRLRPEVYSLKGECVHVRAL